MKIKLALVLILVGMVFAKQAEASTIVITLDQNNVTAQPGDVLRFFGTIENTGNDTLYLNSPDLNLAGNDLSTDYFNLFFAPDFPVSLDSGGQSPDIELFDVTLLTPFTDPLGPYGGTYTLFGGQDPNAQDNLAQANFTINAVVAPVPEPSSVLLLGSGLVSLMYAMRRRFPR